MPLAAAFAAPPGPAPHAAAAAQPLSRRSDVEERVEELSLYTESDDAVGNGDIWHVPGSVEMFGKDGFTFRDFVDIINPLQHIPLVSTVYRAATDDTLDPGARLLGGALFGGVGGLAAAIVNAVVEDETGADIGGNILAAMTGGSGDRQTAGAAPRAGAVVAAAQTKTQTKTQTAAHTAPPALPDVPNSPASPLSGRHRGAEAPISLLPRTAAAAPDPGTVAPPRAAPPDAVPRLMMDALEKYEALSRARRGQALAEEI